MTAAAAAAMAGDHGRKPHELPWFYLDSVGQEYGPIPGWTMREWLSLGRFPVGSDLRVRLPEWERHLPLHQLYPELGAAFVLPPAWPDMYADGVLRGDDSSAKEPTPAPAPPLPGAADAGTPGAAGALSGAAAVPAAAAAEAAAVPSAASQPPASLGAGPAAAADGGVAMGGGGTQPRRTLPRDGAAGVPPHAAGAAAAEEEEASGAGAGGRGGGRREGAAVAQQPWLPTKPPKRPDSPPPDEQFVLERLLQEGRLLRKEKS